MPLPDLRGTERRHNLLVRYKRQNLLSYIIEIPKRSTQKTLRARNSKFPTRILRMTQVGIQKQGFFKTQPPTWVK